MNNKEIQNLRSLLESGQRMAISTKDFEKVFDEIDRLKKENEKLKEEKRYYIAALKHSCNEVDKSNKWQIAERQEKNKYRKALEEINRALLGVRGLSIHCDKQIIKVKSLINEVLNEK